MIPKNPFDRGKPTPRGERKGNQGDTSFLRPKRCQACDVEYAPANGAQKYCSAECREESWLKTSVCHECGEEFRRARHNTLHKFCSSQCSNKATARGRKGKPGRFGKGSVAVFPHPAICAGCGADYMKKSKNVRFCSRSCHMKDRHKKARASAIPRWGIKSKGEDACRNCKRPASHLHHIVPRSRSRAGREDIQGNGLPLCWECHMGWHHRTVTLYHHMLTDEEFAAAVRYAGGWWVEHNYPDRPVVAATWMPESRQFVAIAERIRLLLESEEYAA